MATAYKVRSGDTLGKIAVKFYGSAGRYPMIVAANSIANPDRLTLGQELIIPDAATAAAGLGPPASPPPVQPAPPPNPFNALNDKRLAGLHPILATRGRSMIDLCGHAAVALLVTQGLRTYAEQDALYAQGRSAPGKIVTYARGGESYHNFGLAFDVVVLDALGKADWDSGHPAWATAAEIGQSVGLEWGGSWKKLKDLPHYQYTAELDLKECRALLSEGGLAAVWARVS
jgi:peptidoglycan L-alanyl-D-glutamate endopeptidase CwlK